MVGKPSITAWYFDSTWSNADAIVDRVSDVWVQNWLSPPYQSQLPEPVENIVEEGLHMMKDYQTWT